MGFSPRSANLVLYVGGFPEYEELLRSLGKHRRSKACLYLNKLADVGSAILEDIIRKTYAASTDTDASSNCLRVMLDNPMSAVRRPPLPLQGDCPLIAIMIAAKNGERGRIAARRKLGRLPPVRFQARKHRKPPFGSRPIADIAPMHSKRVMNALPEPPPPYEHVITQKLVECGLSAQGLKVSYIDDFRSYEIVVSVSANARPEMFACIRDAAAGEIVTFDDQELGSAYDTFVAEAFRPQMLASAEAALSKRGLLEGIPRRADFASDALFGEALEEHCGLPKGEAIRPFGDALAFQPPPEVLQDLGKAMERYSCLLSAIQLANARGEGKFGFVGNKAVRSPD